MNKTRKFIARNFDLAAESYNIAANIQRETGFRLIDMITSINSNFSSVIDAGCGTGLTTDHLARRIIYKTFTACDISTCSLAEAALLPSSIDRVELDFNEIEDVTQSPDLIFANMSLHWSPCLVNTLTIFNRALVNSGLLAFTIPLTGTFKEMDGHYARLEFLSQTEVIHLLLNSGFKLLRTDHTCDINYYDNTFSALRAIKQTGVTYTQHRSRKSLLGKKHFISHPITQLTYNTGYFLAIKEYE